MIILVLVTCKLVLFCYKDDNTSRSNLFVASFIAAALRLSSEKTTFSQFLSGRNDNLAGDSPPLSCVLKASSEASPTFGHANANFSVFDRIRNEFLKE